MLASVARGPMFSVALLTVALALAPRETAYHDDSPQVAVRPGGYLVIEGEGGSRRLTELDRHGNRESAFDLSLPDESRVVGTRGGTAVVWRDGAKIRVAGVDKQGRIGQSKQFGNHAVKLCEGVASNDLRFAVGWLESDDRVWIVHGPANARPTERSAIETAAPPVTWCAVASAGKQVVMAWRAKTSVALAMCDANKCGYGNAVKLELQQASRIDAMGCVGDGCVFAVRDPGMGTRLGWYKKSGTRRWSKPLSDARNGAHVAIVGVGDNGVAVAYETADGEVAIVRATLQGAIEPVWKGKGMLPGLAWANGQLVMGYRDHDGELATLAIRMPR